jgi:hypothetical protein
MAARGLSNRGVMIKTEGKVDQGTVNNMRKGMVPKKGVLIDFATALGPDPGAARLRTHGPPAGRGRRCARHGMAGRVADHSPQAQSHVRLHQAACGAVARVVPQPASLLRNDPASARGEPEGRPGTSRAQHHRHYHGYILPRHAGPSHRGGGDIHRRPGGGLGAASLGRECAGRDRGRRGLEDFQRIS